MKLWAKDYALDQQIEDFTVGEDYLLDQALVQYDCRASIAHAQMLGKIGILTEDEVQSLVNELHRIIALDQNGEFIISKAQEDCHTAIENHLTATLGDLGKKIHTARSRNDQVLVALRLYQQAELRNCRELVEHVITAITHFVEKYGEIALPGYTHTRKAMPSTIKLWGTAFIDSMRDNLKLVEIAEELINQCPLGTGAGYGVPLELDRAFTAQALGFARVLDNPIYAQHSRGKFDATIIHVLGQIMLDVNKIASDLIIFSLPEIGYFELPKEFCTGSSIMPHKANPDVLELLRARYHVILSYEFQIKSLVGNLISGYHRDLQLTKEPLMNAFTITKESLGVTARVFEFLKVNAERCQQALTEEVYATAEVYQLVKEGIPFREAYQRIAKRYTDRT